MLLRRMSIVGLLGASATLVFVIAPSRITLNADSPELSLQAAWAKEGSGGGSEKGGTGKAGSSRSGGKADTGGGTGKAGSKSESSGGSGKNGGRRGGDDSAAAQSNARNDSAAERKSGGGGLQRVNPVTGDLIELKGSNIKVLHPEGMKEQIENGRYVMKDAVGRTIINRPATEADSARLRGLMR
ncbi:hypothetical protein SAMN04488498_1284 [Mesorhizobium albiziae]|uniref:Glycine-rich cell wall protein n=1 Tax=Neomesorhizobium albiziae TaxID=335020 RepID=A0A1I4ENA9_9HYPH|nr:hypothetical protein [Mesorhizobium albiziae]GLS31361.1 hypothetical protein GCM10007937_30710 [Mesorhizobium albiziae]SFL06570.1 hypothetical protein SAMN04488498_1284 [Mesorhizobium albiziae]